VGVDLEVGIGVGVVVVVVVVVEGTDAVGLAEMSSDFYIRIPRRMVVVPSVGMSKCGAVDEEEEDEEEERGNAN
jgi:hypothetical protein